MRKPVSPMVTELNEIFRKLRGSAGPRARRNARQRVRTFLAKLKDEVNRLYPPMDAEGNECPVCKTPMRSRLSLAKHLKRNHSQAVHLNPASPAASEYGCCCGRRFSWRSFVQHVARIQDLETHFTLGALAQMGAR